MAEPDDLEPRHKIVKPLDLQPMSISELENYIVSLEAEIARAEQMIAKKESHKSGIDALFGGGKT